MPYVHEHQRKKLDEWQSAPETPGELNYVITSEILGYLDARSLSYQTINDVVGALECAKQEFYRRVVAPYEDAKVVENGDVYP